MGWVSSSTHVWCCQDPEDLVYDRLRVTGDRGKHGATATLTISGQGTMVHVHAPMPVLARLVIDMERQLRGMWAPMEQATATGWTASGYRMGAGPGG